MKEIDLFGREVLARIKEFWSALFVAAVRRADWWRLVGQGLLARGGYALPYQEHQHGHH